MYGGGFGENFGVIVGDVEALGMDHPRWANITVFFIVQQKGVHFNIKSSIMPQLSLQPRILLHHSTTAIFQLENLVVRSNWSSQRLMSIPQANPGGDAKACGTVKPAKS